MGKRLDSCWFLSILLSALLRSTESKTLRNISRSKSVLAPKSRSNSWPLQPTCRNALWSKIWVVDPIAPFSWCYVCVCVSWHLKLQEVVVLQRTIRLHELLQVVFSIRTPFWILVDIGATGFDVFFFDVFAYFAPILVNLVPPCATQTRARLTRACPPCWCVRRHLHLHSQRLWPYLTLVRGRGSAGDATLTTGGKGLWSMV